MSLADKILALESERERNEVFVPEWGVTLFATPMTAFEQDKLMKEYASLQEGKADLRALAGILVMKAEDEDGSKVFGVKDKSKLMRTNAEVLGRVVNALTAVPETQAEVGND